MKIHRTFLINLIAFIAIFNYSSFAFSQSSTLKQDKESSSRHFLYYHGGPGFNSHPEEEMLKPIINSKKSSTNRVKIFFWNEPKQFNANQALYPGQEFNTLMKSAEDFLNEHYLKYGKLNLIGHSFGAYITMHLALKHADKIDQILLIAPALDLHSADLGLLKMGLMNLRNNGKHEQANQLENLIHTLSPEFNDQTIQASLLVLDETFFFNYFYDLQIAQNFLNYFVPPYEMSIPAFFAIRKDTVRYPLEGKPLALKITVLFGDKDYLIKSDDQLKVLKQFSVRPVNIIVFSDTRHYPHIEKKKKFIQLIKNL